jgi:hypothetical protein
VSLRDFFLGIINFFLGIIGLSLLVWGLWTWAELGFSFGRELIARNFLDKDSPIFVIALGATLLAYVGGNYLMKRK